jgi:hydrophobic/amphiphilic exporter-1 (mainly G- bacteria), HAE1 family
MTITEISIRRPALITMIFVALGVLGIFGYSKLGVDLLPKMDFPFVTVLTVYPGAGPEEIEQLISKPVEEGIAATSQLDNVRSISAEGYSMVLAQYQLTQTADKAAADADRQMANIRGKLPKDARTPIIVKNDINSKPIIRVTMTSPNLTSTEAYQFAKDKIKSRLESIDGVAQIEITGGREREIQVSVDREKLKAYNLSILQVAGKLQAENLDFPTGKVSETQNQYTVRVPGKFTSLEEIKNLPLMTTPTGSTVYVGDVATIEDTYKEDHKPTRLSGKDGIGLLIIKQSDANATQTADRLYAAFDKLKKEYASENLEFTIAQDVTQFTRHSLAQVGWDLLFAIIMVSAILFLFLRSGRNALIVMLSIPTSLITTFLFMWIFGFTLNLMSTMALALVIGILVDDSIVVLENIHNKMKQGLSPVQAAIAGRNEIGFAALAITLVDVVVFLPISLVEGLAGKIFREFGLTVVVATLLSLFVSFTLTPLLSAKFGKAHTEIKFFPLRWLTDKFEAFQVWLENTYRGFLDWALNHRKTILVTSFIAVAASCGVVGSGKIPGEFITTPQRNDFQANFEFPAGTTLETADEAIKKFEEKLDKDPNVESHLTIVGLQESAWGKAERGNIGQIQVNLIPKEKRKESTNDMMNKVQQMSESIPGLIVRTAPVGIFGTANESPVMMEIRGDNMADILKYTDTCMKAMKSIPGLKDMKSSYEEGVPEVRVIFDRDRLSAYGLTIAEAAAGMRTALAGNQDSKYREGDTEYDINVLLAKLDRSNASDVADITIVNRTGQIVKLSDVATIAYGKGPTLVTRKNKMRVVTVTAGLDGATLDPTIAAIEAKIKDIPRPSSVTEPYFAGEAENSRRSSGDMGIAFMLAILFVYMIMVALFESYAHPFTIMFSLPVASIGAIGFLWAGGLTLSLFTMVGMIMLMGLVTKNAILIVDRANAQLQAGHTIREAIMEAGPSRIRPIVMTTVTMILGMLPMAIGHGVGAEMRQGMAVAIVGGLVSSLVFTVFLVPVMFTYIESARHKLPRFFSRINIFKKTRKPRPAFIEDFQPAVAEGVLTRNGAARKIEA